MSRLRLSQELSDLCPATALSNAVANARSAEGCALLDASSYWDVDEAAASRLEWAWALVYLLEWVRRG